MAKKTFNFDLKVYLRDINLFGNVYFANYFFWQGVAREEFFRQVAPDPMFFVNRRIQMVTIEASMKFKKEAKLFDNVTIEVKIANPKIMTFELHFTFINKTNKEILGEGKQKIGFINDKMQVIPIPKELAVKGIEYL